MIAATAGVASAGAIMLYVWKRASAASLDEPSTRRTHTPLTLLSLPSDERDEIFSLVLSMHLPSALRLCQTCSLLRHAAFVAEAEARRLHWWPELSCGVEINNEGCTATQTDNEDAFDGYYRCAVGSLLPTTGNSSWRVRVDTCFEDAGGQGLTIGVCDVQARCCWGLDVETGKLQRVSRNNDGRAYRMAHKGTPPPTGFPKGSGRRIMKAEAGQPACLKDNANGAVVEVIFDHDEGELAYRVNGGPSLPALQGFPRGGQLRSCVMMLYHGDRMSFTPPYLSGRVTC
jgi:hypothetical protein